jgi:hypothetical protein
MLLISEALSMLIYIYIYIYICPNLEFTTGILGRYQINPGIEHCKAVKKALMYLQSTKMVSC